MDSNDKPGESLTKIYAQIIEKDMMDLAAKEALYVFNAMGDYEILKLRGIGGYGYVFEVRDRHNRVMKAAKIVSPITEGEDNLWWVLNHPNILYLEECKRLTLCSCAYIMPLVDCDLAQLMVASEFYYSPDSFARKKYFTWQILNGLDYLHSLGLCHFDLKVENIMVYTSSDHAVIGDFSTISRIHKKGHYYFAVNQISQPPECRKHSYRVKHGSNAILAEMWTFGMLVIQLFTICIMERCLLDQSAHGFYEGIYPFLKCVLRKRNIQAVLQKAHPESRLFVVDARELIDFVNQFLALVPSKRITADLAMTHEFLDANLSRCSSFCQLVNSEPSTNVSEKEINQIIFNSASESLMHQSRSREEAQNECPSYQVSTPSNDGCDINIVSTVLNGTDNRHSNTNDSRRLSEVPNQRSHQLLKVKARINFPKLKKCNGCCKWWAENVFHCCSYSTEKEIKKKTQPQKLIKKSFFSVFGMCGYYKCARDSFNLNEDHSFEVVSEHFNYLRSTYSLISNRNEQGTCSLPRREQGFPDCCSISTGEDQNSGMFIVEDKFCDCSLEDNSIPECTSRNVALSGLIYKDEHTNFLRFSSLDLDNLPLVDDSLPCLCNDNRETTGTFHYRHCASVTGSCYVRRRCYCRRSRNSESDDSEVEFCHKFSNISKAVSVPKYATSECFEVSFSKYNASPKFQTPVFQQETLSNYDRDTIASDVIDLREPNISDDVYNNSEINEREKSESVQKTFRRTKKRLNFEECNNS